jgi:hypothetical protein
MRKICALLLHCLQVSFLALGQHAGQPQRMFPTNKFFCLNRQLVKSSAQNKIIFYFAAWWECRSARLPWLTDFCSPCLAFLPFSDKDWFAQSATPTDSDISKNNR